MKRESFVNGEKLPARKHVITEHWVDSKGNKGINNRKYDLPAGRGRTWISTIPSTQPSNQSQNDEI